MTNLNPSLTDLQRLIDLPDLIKNAGKSLGGMRSDKEKVERTLKSIESRLRLSEAVKAEKNAEERAARLLLLCEADPAWVKATDRLDELTGTIRARQEERNYLDNELKVLHGRLLASFVPQLQALIEDRRMTEMIGRGLLS